MQLPGACLSEQASPQHQSQGIFPDIPGQRVPAACESWLYTALTQQEWPEKNHGFATNCFVAPTSKCLACCEPFPMHPFAASSLSHTCFHIRSVPPAQTLLEFLSLTASLSQENCSALFSGFLTAFKGLLTPVCFKNAEHSLSCSLFAFPALGQHLLGPRSTTAETQYT